MKHSLFLLLLLFPLLSFGQSPQKNLAMSPRASAETFVYRLNRDEVRAIYLKDQSPDESMLHTLAARFDSQAAPPKLPDGNYLLVRAVENDLTYRPYTVGNLYHELVQDARVMLFLCDTLGQAIDNAVVRQGRRQLRFDPNTRTYNTRKVKDETIVEVDHNGVLHYIEFWEYDTARFRKDQRIKNWFRRIFSPNKVHAPKRTPYQGFVVFSKPKYKPGETVRFKAYVNRNGRPYQEAVDVLLTSYSPKMDTTLMRLSPYRPGLYEGEFTLTDSLRLKLDNYYYLRLSTKEKNTNNVQSGFYYEDYQLKRITFTAKADRKEYLKSDTVRITLNASDENGMPVYDGKVKLSLSHTFYRVEEMYTDQVFIPKEIWSETVDMTGLSKEVPLPDSIFPENISTSYELSCEFLDASNEKHTKQINFRRDGRDHLIDFSVDKNIMTIREINRGESLHTSVRLTAYTVDGEIIRQDSVTLPYEQPLLWNATEYKVESGALAEKYSISGNLPDPLSYRFFRQGDTVRLVVDNPARIPFWYTIGRGKTTIESGYTTELDFARKDRGKNGYTMQLSYLFNDQTRSKQGSLPYAEPNLTMQVTTPTTVYPGQTATVDVAVYNRRGKPVANTDITAYGFTSKFDENTPKIPGYGKAKYGKAIQYQRSNIDEHSPGNSRSPMNWELWRERMGLDSIEYYQFLHPQPFYAFTAAFNGHSTTLKPYVMLDGEVQGTHILWIDEQPYYFSQTQQVDQYNFPVDPGYHTVKIRTHDREVTIENAQAWVGAETVISVDGNESHHDVQNTYYPANIGRSPLPMKITVRKFDQQAAGILTPLETDILKRYLISVGNDVLGTQQWSRHYWSSEPNFFLPATLQTTDTYYYLNPVMPRRDYNNESYQRDSLLVGPFPFRGFHPEGKNIGTLYVDSVYRGAFEIEGGYHYTFTPRGIKQTSWSRNPIRPEIKPYKPVIQFNRPLNRARVQQKFRARQDSIYRDYSSLLTSNTRLGGKKSCLLVLTKGQLPARPLLICLTGANPADTLLQIYGGKVRHFAGLPEGKVRIHVFFSRTAKYSTEIELRKNGTNFLKIDTRAYESDDELSQKVFDVLDSKFEIVYSPDPVVDYPLYPNQKIEFWVHPQQIGEYSMKNRMNNVLTGTIRDKAGLLFPGIEVTLRNREGVTIFKTESDSTGRFCIPYPETRFVHLYFAKERYRTIRTGIYPGWEYSLTMEKLYNPSGLVYGAFNKSESFSFTGAANLISASDSPLDFAAMGSAASVRIRGTNTAPLEPLIVVDGVPYNGALSDISPDDIASVNVMKDASTSIYGPRAAAGVVFVQTKGRANAANGFPAGWESANTLRTNFHDDAFWHPRLSTDKEGKLSFEVTYPDDITRWDTHFIAVGGRKQTSRAQLQVKSFKPRNAQLSLPLFAIAGDSLHAVGRLTNHIGDTITVKRTIESGLNSQTDDIRLAASHTDDIPITVPAADSLQVTYTLSTGDGYFDGEQRSIPVYKPGIQETHGEFALLTDTLSHGFVPEPELGQTTVRAETTGIEFLLDEIDRTDRYAYFCNEQTASKVKALLARKRIFALTGQKFNDQTKIRKLIERLENSRNDEKLWGWWKANDTEWWITVHTLEALFDAQQEGFRVDVDWSGITHKLTNRMHDLRNDELIPTPHAIQILALLQKIDPDTNYATHLQWLPVDPGSIHDRLLAAEIRQKNRALKHPEVDSLLARASKTTLGSLYWPESPRRVTRGTTSAYLTRPYANATANTLIAYRIMQAQKGYEREKAQIMNYFFEIRRNGWWVNTYESSRIVETILPDLLKADQKGNTTLTINGKTYDQFPFTETFGAGEELTVRHNGARPVFFTAHQQAWNETPVAKSEGFRVETFFMDGRDTVTTLKAGKAVNLYTNVHVESETGYVMVEIPIPAGCTYDSKHLSHFWSETHWEHYKDRVVIFFNRLSSGKHEFRINLLPRYTGRYHLNPARVELMYYPTFFGHESAKMCDIE